MIRGTARWVTLAWAVASTMAALFVARLGTIIEIFGKIRGFFSGTILGVFLLGILFKRASSAAALIGLVAGTAFTAWVSTTSASWLWYGSAGCGMTLLAGWIVSLWLPRSVELRGFDVARAIPPVVENAG